MSALANAPNPLVWFNCLRWLDGRNLLSTIEPYRRQTFEKALFTFDADGWPCYSRVLIGRAKKNNKTTDLILAGLYRFLAWPSPAGNDCFVVANDEEQAADDLSLAKKLIHANPILGREVKVLTKWIDRKDGGGRFQILPSQDVSGLHGKTYLYLGYDEIHGQRNYDLFEALSPDPTRLDVLVWITSYAGIRHAPGIPLYDMMQVGKSGEDKRLYFSWHGGDFTTDEALQGEDVTPEQRANPSMGSWGNAHYLDEQRRRLPPHKFRRLHLNLPGSPDGAAFNAESVQACIVRGRKRLMPRPDVIYFAFVDMGGGSRDAAVLCIGHVDGGTIVIDLLMGVDAPFNPRDVVRKFVAAMDEYGVHRVFGDKFAGQTFQRDFEDLGKRYTSLDNVGKDKLYQTLDPKINGGLVELPDELKLEEQLLTLVVKPSGKITPPTVSDHDDYANAVAGLVHVAVVEEGAPALVRPEAALVNDRPVPMPKWAMMVMSVQTVKDATAAIGYFAYHPPDMVSYSGPCAPLILIDGYYGPLVGVTMNGMRQKLEDLHREVGSVAHLAYVPESALQTARLDGVDAQAWPKELLQDLPGLALNAVGHIDRGWFKVSERADATGIPWRGALTYRADEKLDDHPLKLALLIGIGLALRIEGTKRSPAFVPSSQVMVHGYGR
jgi:hypothetical protein